MKKPKGSKAKKPFAKNEDQAAVNNGEPVAIEEGLVGAEELPAVVNGGVAAVVETQANPETAIDEVGSRIEFEDIENGKSKSGKNYSRSVSRDPWQQAFADENTILIKRTVRSGQCIQFDGNVVVLGDVNPGSEIIASGNIVVMGALRGVVHAGATGNEDASVAAFKLQPTQLRIANHITRAPDGEYNAPDHPEIARIKDGVVVIEVYQLGQDRQTKIC